jgi:Ni,Fe-hydrogenase III large subunit
MTAHNTYTIPVGPLHVALEEPMYFHIDVEGETVRAVDIRAGHVHRGVEYLTTKRTIYQNVVLTERICALCSNSHPETFVMACEQIAGLQIPPRAAYLRVIAAEIKRVASHLFNVGILAHLTGYETLFMHAMQVREVMQDVKETLFGNRMDIAAMCIGGVRYDLDEELTAFLSASLDKVAPEADALTETYRRNGTILRRTKGIGALTKDQAVACAVVGPVARACGLDYDVRVAAPYAAYAHLSVRVPTLADGDVWSRAMVRLSEIGASIEIIRQCLHDLPDGPVRLGDRPDIPAGRAMGKCEAPRGELVYFLKTNGAEEPERVKWRVPSFPNWDALRFMLEGAKIADIAIIVNSIDPCVSCTER